MDKSSIIWYGKTRHPIFIVEGPDGAGKTTLCETLKGLVGARYIHLTYRFKDKMHLYHGAAFNLAVRWSEKQPVIIDRWWPSEIVYADAYRGGSKFAKHYLLLDYMAQVAGTMYVVCLPEDRELYLNHFKRLQAEREEMYDEGLDRVYDGYVEAFSFLGLRENAVRYDIFRNWASDEISRELRLRNMCQLLLEYTSDYRSTL